MLKLLKKMFCGFVGHNYKLLAVGEMHYLWGGVLETEGAYYTIRCQKCNHIQTKDKKYVDPSVIKKMYKWENNINN